MDHISMVNNKLIRLSGITSIDELMCFWKFSSSALFTVQVIIKFLTPWMNFRNRAVISINATPWSSCLKKSVDEAKDLWWVLLKPIHGLQRYSQTCYYNFLYHFLPFLSCYNLENWGNPKIIQPHSQGSFLLVSHGERVTRKRRPWESGYTRAIMPLGTQK